MTTIRQAPITSADIRAAMSGAPLDGVQIVRRAGADADEVALLEARGDWWVARRVAGHVTVWGYAGDAEAEDGFDQLVASAQVADSKP